MEEVADEDLDDDDDGDGGLQPLRSQQRRRLLHPPPEGPRNGARSLRPSDTLRPRASSPHLRVPGRHGSADGARAAAHPSLRVDLSAPRLRYGLGEELAGLVVAALEGAWQGHR